jgi:hypothetical protein
MSKRTERFIAGWWWVPLSLVGMVLLFVGPSLVDTLFSNRSASPATSTGRPFYITDPNGGLVGWWQVKFPTQIMSGNSAELEVSYIADPKLFHEDRQDAADASASPALRQYRQCQFDNASGKQWGRAEQECGPAPVDGAASSLVPRFPEIPPIKFLAVRIRHSDLPYKPDDDRVHLDLNQIFSSSGHSANCIWSLPTDTATEGKKLLILSFDVSPASYQQHQVEMNSGVMSVVGNEVGLPITVLTKYGISRQTVVLCTLLVQGLGAILTSSGFLLVLKWFLDRLSAKRATPGS